MLALDEEAPEASRLLAELGLLSATDPGRVRRSVLAEGFTRTDPAGFLAELRRRLARLSRVHALAEGVETAEAWGAELAHVAAAESRLTLARYLWSPQEVVRRIHRQIRASRGVPAPLDRWPDARREAEAALARLPPFEAAIAASLLDERIYWVADATGSRLHSMVEYPLGTVVLTIKPPGSDLELQIKRAGRRGPRPLDAVRSRDGRKVPPSHRLDGGSSVHSLAWDARASALLARLYRRIHGEEAPLSRIVSLKSIYGVPAAREEHLVSYFDQPECYGDGFAPMRAELRRCLAAFARERPGSPAIDTDSRLGRTAAFLYHTAPGQAVLVGTSSFRLDRISAYLSDEGPHAYFTEGLGVAFDRAAARRLADDVLEEVLGVLEPPHGGYESHRDYVERALAVPANRRRADTAYRAAMRQIGRLWGTLLAFRGYSRGESFVARNVGLRSVWEDGQWRVEILFMDHDELFLNGLPGSRLQPLQRLGFMAADETYLFGGEYPWESVRGSVEHLEGIYGVDAATRKRGRDALRRSVEAAYREAHRRVRDRPEDLEAMVGPEAVAALTHGSEVIAEYLAARAAGADPGVPVRRTVRALGYSDDLADFALRELPEHAELVERWAFLWTR